MKIYDIMLFVNEYRKRCLRYFCLFSRTIAHLAIASEPTESGLKMQQKSWNEAIWCRDIFSVSYLGKGDSMCSVLIKLDTAFTGV